MNPSSSQKPLNTLDAVVKKLQWAAVGKSEPSNSSDDIDSYVSSLIIEEAKKSSKLYEKVGARAYLDPSTGSDPCQLKKTNKVFLNNIVKNTNSHNRYIAKTLGSAAKTPSSNKPYKRTQSPKHSASKSQHSTKDRHPKSYHEVDYKYKDSERKSSRKSA
ncbi:hypothetical protein DSO57_1027201 [Entomophthora muscae]|uniref:Uncharacterized protein n=1 Tax=Entomophthora muscae TaxID=34485 RepID=A0ACC2TCR2_9FUNG|nr:hypothetical protein DSO57_1027201 [Entomophthora muscae]